MTQQIDSATKQRILALRNKRNQREIARLVGKSEATVSRILREAKGARSTKAATARRPAPVSAAVAASPIPRPAQAAPSISPNVAPYGVVPEDNDEELTPVDLAAWERLAEEALAGVTFDRLREIYVERVHVGFPRARRWIAEGASIVDAITSDDDVSAGIGALAIFSSGAHVAELALFACDGIADLAAREDESSAQHDARLARHEDARRRRALVLLRAAVRILKGASS